MSIKTEKSWSIEPVGVGRRDYSREVEFSVSSEQRKYFRHPTGRPYYIETWEHPRAWSFGQTLGGTGEYEISSGYNTSQPGVFAGGQMCKMTSPTINGGYSRLAYITGPLLNERLGIEVNFALPYTHGTVGNYLRQIEVGFWRERGVGTTKLQPYAAWDLTNNRLIIGDYVATQTMRENLSNYFFTGSYWLTWQNIKLIADLAEAKFIKLYFNEMEFDLSNISINGSAAVHTYPWLNSYVLIKDLAVAVTGTIYLGNIILTMEEE